MTEQLSTAKKLTGGLRHYTARSVLQGPAMRRKSLNLLSAAMVIAGASLFSLTNLADAKAQSATVPEAELLKPSPGLKDIQYGKDDAKITIVEYASMTCPHCATFHNNVFPELKKKFIDVPNAKVRLIFREFPLDNLAAGASMLARCAGKTDPEKTKKMIEVLFARQRSWTFVRSNPLPPLFAIAKQAGFTEATFNACLKDEKMLKALINQRSRASKKFGVNSTPHFFINGKRMGAGSLQDFEREIKAIK